MSEEKSKQNDLDDPEITRLRDVVLKWIEKSKNSNATAVEKLKTKDKLEKNRPEIKNSLVKIKNLIAEGEVLKPINPPLNTKRLVDTRTKLKSQIYPKYSNQIANQTVAKIIGGLAALVCLGVVVLVTGVYALGWDNKVTLEIERLVPLPAALVNAHWITLYDWHSQVNTLNNFYQNQLSTMPKLAVPTTNQTQRHVLERIIDNALLEQLAGQYAVSASPAEIDAYIKILSEEIGSSAALEAQVRNLYNWTMDQFKKEIVRPIILKSHLAKAITLDDRVNQNARLTAQQALTEVRVGLIPFETLAQKYSEDITAVQGGDLGYFSRGQLELTFEEAAFGLKPGETSDIVQTRYGFHIIKVEEALQDEAGLVTQIRAKHILIRGKDLETFLAETKQAATIWRLVKIKTD